jgi:transposase
MRSQGSAPELERRRELAVARVAEGYAQKEVAAILGVHANSVSRWVCSARDQGADALKARPTPGRPPKLSARQEQTVLGWVTRPPTRFGFPTDLWTSRRLAALIEGRFGIRFNSNYLVEWLHARKQSPQKPAQPARERDEAAIARWAKEDWPRLQKKREKKKLILSSSTRAASS